MLRYLSETGHIQFRDYGFKHRAQRVFPWPSKFRGEGSASFLSAYDLFAKPKSLSFSQNSASLAQNSVISLFRSSALETIFRLLPSLPTILDCGSQRAQKKNTHTHTFSLECMKKSHFLTHEKTILAWNFHSFLKFSFSLEDINPEPCFSAAREGLGLKVLD